MTIAQQNTKRLLEAGAREYAPGHYPLIVAVHVGWLAALWWFAPGREIHWPLIGLFALLQLARVWVLRTLGPRWTTRIIVLPGAPLVLHGPFRFVRHPNYLVVIGEIAVLPLAFGLWEIAAIFSVLNAAVLAIRIRAEEKALGSSA
jgi:methyltransferase